VGTRLPLNFTEDAGTTVREKTGADQIFQLSFAQAYQDSELGSIYKAVRNKFTERSDDITDHHALNKEFPDLEVPFNVPTSRALAEQIDSDNRRRRTVQKTIAEGGESTLNSVASIGGSILGTAIDPKGVPSGLQVGAGVSKVLGTAAKMSRGAVFAREAAEGVVGNVAAEALIINPVARSEKRDIDTYDSLTNAVIGAVAFPVLKQGLGKTIDILGKFKNGAGLEKGFDVGEQQLQAGKSVELNDYADSIKFQKKTQLEAERLDLEAGDPRIADIDEQLKDLDVKEPNRAEVAAKSNSEEAE